MLDVEPAVDHWKARGLDFSSILYNPPVPSRVARRCVHSQDHGLNGALDHQLVEHSLDALLSLSPLEINLPVRNIHRSVGTMLSGEVARRYGASGLPDETLRIHLNGSAGQSLGAFLAKGITITLEGEANDYVGKGLSGGRLMVRPAESAPFVQEGADSTAEEQIIAGNTILYGATGGELFLRGRVGERFAVRNSGATAVVEGVGDHGCEYMTGGTVVVLGPIGRNFAAGMSGGVAYVWQLERERVNTELVDLLDVSTEDEQLLHQLVRRHAEATGSVVAARLLRAWPQARAEFTVVVPRDYQRIVKVIRAAQAAGRDIDENVMAELAQPAKVGAVRA
jgi:glutamate synthase (NADPH/NADH) large chain